MSKGALETRQSTIRHMSLTRSNVPGKLSLTGIHGHMILWVAVA